MSKHKTPANRMGLYMDHCGIPQDIAEELVRREFETNQDDVLEIAKQARETQNASTPDEVLEIARKVIEFNKTGVPQEQEANT